MQREVESIFVSDVLYALYHRARRLDADAARDPPRRQPARDARAAAHVQAAAYLSGREYLIPQDVQAVFENVCAHRILLSPRALVSGVSEQQLVGRALSQVQAPVAV